MILDQPEVISWPSCDRPSLQTVNSFPKKWTHREPIPEVRFQLSSPREGETGSQFRRSYAKTDHLHESDCMTHDSFLTHSRKSLERYSRQNTSDGISGHLNTSGLSIIYEIGNENFQFLPLGGARIFIFWLHHRVQEVRISIPTNFNKYPIPLTLIMKTRLRRVETLIIVTHLLFAPFH